MFSAAWLCAELVRSMSSLHCLMAIFFTISHHLFVSLALSLSLSLPPPPPPPPLVSHSYRHFPPSRR